MIAVQLLQWTVLCVMATGAVMLSILVPSGQLGGRRHIQSNPLHLHKLHPSLFAAAAAAAAA